MTNAQVALLAAALVVDELDTDKVIGRADMFAMWLERKDRERREVAHDASWVEMGKP